MKLDPKTFYVVHPNWRFARGEFARAKVAPAECLLKVVAIAELEGLHLDLVREQNFQGSERLSVRDRAIPLVEQNVMRLVAVGFARDQNGSAFGADA